MRIFPLLLLVALPLCAQDRDARWLADAEFLYQRILATHPNPTNLHTRAEFDETYQKLREQIPSSSDGQVVLGLSRLAALANDAHTSLDFTQYSGLRRYPITFRWFSDGLFLTAAPLAQASFIGRRVTRIGNASFDEAAEAIRPWISHDTENWFRAKAQSAFTVHDVLAAAGLVEPGAPLAVEFADAQGELSTTEFALGSASTISGPHLARPLNPLYRRNPNSYYWYAWLEDSRTVYVQYNRCAESPLLSIAAFAQEMLAFAKANRVDRWIFDLRENTGGNSAYFTQLINAFGQAYVTGQVPLPALGAYGIVGKNTFSSGTLAAVDVLRAGMTLVGETTGGRVSWYGEVVPVVLPNSRLTGSVSTRIFAIPGFPAAITPEFQVDFRGEDYFADRDPFLERALSLTRPVNLAAGQ